MIDHEFYNGDFYYYPKTITSIDIGNAVTIIGQDAFYGCENLTSITIPSSVTNVVDTRVFEGCNNVRNVTVPGWTCNIPFFSVTNLVISDGTTSIGSSAFFNCNSLTSVTIPNSVTSIGEAAFSGCSGLTSVSIPNSVTSIGGNAFDGCSGLTSMTIEGKDRATVQGMANYPFGLNWANSDGVIIHCTDGDIPVSFAG